MSLSEKEILQLREKYGVGNNVKTSVSAEQKVADRINGLKEEPSVAQQQTPQVAETTAQTETVQPKGKGLVGKIIDREKSLFSTIKDAAKRQFFGEQTGFETKTQIFGKAGTEAIGMGFDAITSVLSAITPDKVGKKLSDAIAPVFETEAAQRALQAIDRGEEAYNEFKVNNPKDAATIEGIIGLAELATLAPAGARIGTTKTAQRIAEASQLRRTEKAVEAVVDIAKPKMTKKEIMRAIEEGRVTRTGNVQKFFGKPDVVRAEGRVQNAARTVVNEIPDVQNLTDVEVANLAKRRVAEISKELEPKLKNVPVAENIKETVIDSYINTAKNFPQEYPILSEQQIKNISKNFEDIIVELGDANNTDDLWKAVQKYDDSVKRNVKLATSQSPETLQTQKDIWLENRRILRDALDEAVALADQDVASEFKKMSDLYTVRENIINNAEFAKGSGKLTKALMRQGGIQAAGLVGAGVTGALVSDLFQ